MQGAAFGDVENKGMLKSCGFFYMINNVIFMK